MYSADWFLSKFVNGSGKISPNLARQSDTILKELSILTSFLPEDAKPKERIWCLKNGVTTVTVCKECGGRVQLLHGKYNTFCGSRCASKNKDSLEKRGRTNLSKYGSVGAIGNTEIAEKRNKTYLKKYGVEYISQSPEIREKINKTWFNKYGSSLVESDYFKEKRKDTLIEKFGVDSPLKK